MPPKAAFFDNPNDFPIRKRFGFFIKNKINCLLRIAILRLKRDLIRIAKSFVFFNFEKTVKQPKMILIEICRSPIARGCAKRVFNYVLTWQRLIFSIQCTRDFSLVHSIVFGAFSEIFHALSIDADFENISIDSMSCKLHQSANGGKKAEDKAVGMSRGV